MDAKLTERLETLFPAIAKGDRRAFEQLYRLTSPHLYALALRMLRQQGWAEEVLHDCYLTIWNRAASYDSALSAPMTWMTHIVRNRCIDGLRSGQARAALATEVFNDELQIAEEQDRNNWHDPAQADRLRHCISHLSSEQQQSITLAYYQGMSHSDIAAWLQQPVGSVKSWIRRALEHLRECVGL
ncbi:sigma-70 family RNA polymerase sigma factor [Candidatus Pantoea floridensis]|uniref:RNA polymerase sigma-70 factor, ECF subfamily n=1 Tax=Candidatus Pantoea floridensis TaxID=1938870 RepID=A0A286BLE3_9GAMM|nr:sigma-70 family RNA polymerase sigma factor [Pantoea floridensis]PIF22298.1 RNA polymerase sigma-70 factor (ECF subfamily) [Enterobacteriaceae bacterium JKS000233]SOD34965.1 RNA polymerase sigma-70 factor, ECF subfamily [Pantoea floridensis]